LASNLPPLIPAGSNVADALDVNGSTRVDFVSAVDARALRVGHRTGAVCIPTAHVVPAIGSLLYVEVLSLAHARYSIWFDFRALVGSARAALQDLPREIFLLIAAAVTLTPPPKPMAPIRFHHPLT
jgi:hypothetical protein